MRKLISIFILALLANVAEAQTVSKTINVATAGTLTTLLTSTEKTTITDLTVTGNIDARDVKCMRDEITKLANLDISAVSITAYTGSGGTSVSSIYPANEMPSHSFYCTYHTLKTIKLPNSITSIDTSAFDGYNTLTSITIPSAVISIGDYAFRDCSGLTGTLVIPSSVLSLGVGAFSSCNRLTSINISSSVNTIGSGAFWGCSNWGSIYIPSSVTSIGIGAFSSCKGPILVADSNPNYSSVGGILFDKTKSILIQCPISKSGSYNIPLSVKSIEDFAFQNCASLSSILMPTYLNTIGNYAFYSCRGLTSISLPSSISSIGDGSFYACSGLTSINLPSSITSIGKEAFMYCSGLSSIDIPISVNSIKGSTFSDCSSLISISIPMSVTSIESYAFEGCRNLKSIYVYTTTPVSLSSFSGIFNRVNNTSCILYVPRGSKEAYQLAKVWKDFLNIVEMTTTHLPTETCDVIRVYPNPVTDYLFIDGITKIAELTFADLNGRILLTRQVTNNESISLRKLPKGMYIIKLSTDKYTIEQKVMKW